jgi:hypothetical protein
MPANTKALKTDVSTIKPAPQHFDPVSDDYSIQLGTDGAMYTQITKPLPAGTNNIGDVDIASLPSLPAGTNNIGDVDVLTLPPLPAGSNTIGTVNSVQTASLVADVTLQDAANAIGNGTVLTVGGLKTLTIEINGTSTSRTIMFEGASVSGTYYPITGVKTSDLTTAVTTTGTGEVWQFSITGLVSFRARISAIAGGNVNVKGKAVA